MHGAEDIFNFHVETKNVRQHCAHFNTRLLLLALCSSPIFRGRCADGRRGHEALQVRAGAFDF